MGRQAVRAFVVRGDQVLVMHRNKFGQEYYALMGGPIGAGEAPDQVLAREIFKESGVQLANPRLIATDVAGDPFGTQYVYACDYVSGEPALQPQSEQAKITAMGQNLYTPMWLPLAQLKDSPFRSEQLKQALLAGLASGFAQPVTVYSN